MTAKKKPAGLEERLGQVESLIAALESGKLPLEESLKRYEEGIRTLDAVEKELAEAEQRLTVLRTQPDGSEEEEPLEVEP